MSRSDEIAGLVARYFQMDGPDVGLPLAVSPIGADEIAAGIDTLLSGWLTMGQRVRDFEAAWASAIGTQHAVCVNSGSSALLVMLTALVETGMLSRGDEVIVPAVGWSTSLFTVAQAGLRPVLVDVGEDSLVLEGEWDRPVLAVHLLGCPSRASGPLIIEDACGAHGAEIDGARCGSLGVAGAFSFFFSHHLSTIEGGMINTDSLELADAARSIRAHGWVRERSDAAALAAAHPEIDPRFLFVSAGYNTRPTEITGAMGVAQVPKLAGFVAARRRNHAAWCEAIDALGLPLRVFPELPGTLHAAFAFPMLLDADSPLDRAQVCARLEARSIATRPISGSNLIRQPAFPNVVGARVEGKTPVADAVHERGFFVGQSHAFDAAHLDRLIDGLREAFR
jgi:CDP-6-deoxy-D-xylo-4-hexulose-3-dehydrase